MTFQQYIKLALLKYSQKNGYMTKKQYLEFKDWLMNDWKINIRKKFFQTQKISLRDFYKSFYGRVDKNKYYEYLNSDNTLILGYLLNVNYLNNELEYLKVESKSKQFWFGEYNFRYKKNREKIFLEQPKLKLYNDNF